MTKITALIITLNEEKHIAACIDALLPVVDEIVIVDSLSTDRTREIATAKGARVVEEKFEGFGRQKNIGTALASNDLILSVDADEYLSKELQESILSVKKNHTAAAYSFNILTHIGGVAVRSCGWYPDTHTRLYDRRKVKWNERKVHEGLIIDGDVKYLTGDLLHYSYDNFDQMKAKTDHYARLGAEVHKGKNKLALVFKMLVNPIAKFLKTYILQKGITDGYTGWMISWYKARETFYKYYWALG
jgi:(heptosyl)LPS beta-1,4-glucosyltransferase